jgi:probable rRNA maturation factor
VNGESERDTLCVETDGLTLEIDVALGAALLDGKLPSIIATAVGAANAVAGPAEGAVTVIVDNDERIRVLNKLWRDLDKPTNVLSFPYPDTQPGPADYVGDIAISYETAAREAATEGKTLGDHIAHLSVHGFLHLLGYDHESDADADEMEGLERVILARIGISDPYIAHEAQG